MAYTSLLVEESDGVLLVTLNRPEVHNAFNDELIAEAIDVFRDIDRRNVRAVVLRGSGANFCAGADVNWMSRMVSYTRDENVRDSAQLAKMYALINECPTPVVGRIHGAAIGGGVGLVAVCDIAVAAPGAKFGLSEVKLGILPAVISPYVIAKIGQTHARALFLTGERFDAEIALRIGLVHQVADDLDAAVDTVVGELLSAGPQAARWAKRLVRERPDGPETARWIAERRTSEEGQEGLRAFLEKRRASWRD
jgi:methylglutaconyl-CoA hydratase